MDKQPQINKADSKLIFLVDDDNIGLRDFSEILRLEKINVETCREAQEAIKRIEGGLIYDLLIVDRSMPGPGGEEVARISKLTNPTIPIFGMSCYSDRTSLDYFDDYFTKPINPDIIIEQVKLRLNL